MRGEGKIKGQRDFRSSSDRSLVVSPSTWWRDVVEVSPPVRRATRLSHCGGPERGSWPHDEPTGHAVSGMSGHFSGVQFDCGHLHLAHQRYGHAPSEREDLGA
jgi:hypothetical protein